MFHSKLKTLSEAKTTSAFLSSGYEEAAKVLSENGALKYSTTGDPFVDQFGKLGAMKVRRSFEDISRDMSTLWSINPRLCLSFLFFLRMITRAVSFFDGSKTTTIQRGSGLKHEGMMRMIWLHMFYPDVFWKNIQLYISIASWKDIIQMLSYDLQYNGWKGRMLNWNEFAKLILVGLENPNTSELVKKYLPQIKTNSKCTTIEAQADNAIAKWICNLIFGGKTPEYYYYKDYRKLKSSGTAHEWQQLISRGHHHLIDFDTVHGRALSLMVSSKYLENQGIEHLYEAWIESKPVAKFTGYVHELFAKPIYKKYQIDTLNAQFNQLVETASKNASKNTGLIVVRDTSSSMNDSATGTSQSCGDIAKALALFFSEMLPEGRFANAWIEFNSTAVMHKWVGSTAYEKWTNDISRYVGSTNFLSVIKLFATIKSKGVSENEFPSGILCISDSEFNPSHVGTTNVEAAHHMLRDAGFSETYISNFKIILWNLISYSRGGKFETYGNTENVFYFSGYDGSIIAFLTGVDGATTTPKTARELFDAAMSQEVMSKIEM